MRLEVSGCTAAILWGDASRICFKKIAQHPCWFKFKICNHTIVLTRLQMGRFPVYLKKKSNIFLINHKHESDTVMVIAKKVHF